MVDTRRAVAMLAFVTLLLAVAGLADASVNAFWRELGGSASGDGLSKTSTGNYSNSASVAAGLDGRPVVVYAEESQAGFTNDGKIVVKRWTGAAWQTLSPVTGVGSRGYGAQVKLARNGTIYAAWLGFADNQVHLRRRTTTGTVWEELSGSDQFGGLTRLNGSSVGSFSLAVANDNSPIVAFSAPAQDGVSSGTDGILIGSYQAYVVQYVGGSWQYLGSSPTAGGAGASSARSLNVSSGAAYAVHSVGLGGENVQLSIDSAGRPVVAFPYTTTYPSGTPPVEFLPTGPLGSHRDVFVTRLEANSSTWTAVGPAVPQTDDGGAARGAPGGISATVNDVSELAFAASPAGERLHVVWTDANGTPDTPIYLRRWNGVDTWDELNGSASADGLSGGGPNDNPAVAVDGSGNAIVAWRRSLLDGSFVTVSQTFVLRSNSLDQWEEMGPDSALGDGISANVPNHQVFQPVVAHFDSATPTPADNTVVAWINTASVAPNQVFLRQFTVGPRFPLTVNVGPGGRVVSNPIGIDCPDDACTELFPAGQVVSLTPLAEPDSLFDRWLGACTGGAACNVPMTAIRNVNASFVGAATLTIAKDGLGTVTGTGINCGSDCSEKYRLGTLVTLVVTMPAGTLFDGWGGDCAFRGRNTSCAIPMNANSSVSADFTQRLYRLTASLANPAGSAVNGGGATLTGTRNGVPFLTCPYGGGPCSGDAFHGDDVVLQTALDPGNRFLSYTGTICAGRTNATCPFEMTRNYSVVGNLRGVTALQVLKTGNGANKSTVSGFGLACGNDCLGEAFTGSPVVLTQTPGVGNRLVGFTGSCSGATCAFTAQGTNQTITAEYQLNRHSLVVNGDGFGYAVSNPPGIDCGSVAGHSDCTETYDYGQVIALTPFPGENSRFVSWTGCSRLNGTVCLVDMTANRSIFKRFGPARTLTVSGSGNGGGVYSIAGQPSLVCQGNCSASYLLPFNVPVVVTPKASTGSNFRWSSGCPGTAACTQLMSQNRTVAGEFRLNRHRLVVANRLNGSVSTVTPFPDSSQLLCGSGDDICTSEQDFGTQVLLRAQADEGNLFVRWTGTSPCSVGARATNASCAFELRANTTIAADFRPATVVDLVKDGNGSGSLAAAGTLAPPAPLCGPPCQSTRFTAFDSRPVTLRATPSVGSRLVNFLGDCVSNSSTCTFIPSGDNESITATFALQQFVVTIADRPNGTVTGAAPAGTVISCGFAGVGDCTELLDFSTGVTLTAVPNPDAIFVSWTGDAVCAGKTTTVCSFKLPNRTVNVTPVYRTRTIVGLSKGGNGAGSLTATGTLSPAAPVCGPTCSSTLFSAFDGRPVLLRATPSVGSTFAGFSGSCVSNSSTCTFIPSGGNETVTAAFVFQQFALNIVDRPNGTVTGTAPAGTVISCGFAGVGDCTELLDFSTGVTLTAVPNPDAIFVSWTGDAVCAGKTTTVCSFKLPNRTVNVTPVYRTRTIVGLSKGGNGAGSLTATGTLSPAAPVCGPTCTSTLFTAFDGRPVTLRATPSAGSSFGSFSGDCVSNSSTCTYIPSGANSTVTGTFVLQQFGLLVANRANGSVSGSLAGVGEVVLCGDAALDCSESVEFGRSVVLVATPAPGFTFLNWSGDPVCAGRTNATCPFTMPLRNVSVTPSYRRATLVQVTPVGQGTVTGTGISCVSGQAGVTGDCTQVVLNNGSLTLTATPATGWDFDQWDDPSSCAGTAVCTFTPTGETALSGPVFVREQRFASVVVSGNGSVVSGFDGCDTATSPCQFPRLFGDTVVLTATPAAGQQFFSWTGCQSTNGSACTLLMTANRTATVSFLPIAAATVTVGQGSLAFSAPSVTVAAGDTVRWTWASSNHNVVSGPISGAGAGVADGAFCNPGDVSCATAPLVGPPTVYSHTFTTPGTFTYFCRQHRTLGMTGTVTVTE